MKARKKSVSTKKSKVTKSTKKEVRVNRVERRDDGGDDEDADDGDDGLEIDKNLLFIKKDNLSKSKDPCDKYMNNPTDKIVKASQLDQRSKSVHIIKERGNQSIFNLAIEKSHAYFNDIDNEPFRVFGTHSSSSSKSPVAIYPMQRFLMNGFFPVDNMNPSSTISCMTRNLQEECDFIASEKQKEKDRADLKEKSPETAQTDEQCKKRDLSNTKLNQVWGSTYHSFGYNRRIPKELKDSMHRAYTGEKLKIFKQCYEHDCIEADVDFGSIPTDFRMFNDINESYYEKYKAADQIAYDSSEMVPRVSIELVKRSHFRKYRRKPEPDEQVELCSMGSRCVFNVMIKDKHQAYTGRVFYTPDEIKNKVIFNKEKLCIDCILKLWTKTHDLNVSNEIEAVKPMNHFSVKCEPGEYSPHCLLSVEENNKPTGIQKHVPRFSDKNRDNMVVVKNYDDGKQLHTIYTPYLEEIGMDF